VYLRRRRPVGSGIIIIIILAVLAAVIFPVLFARKGKESESPGEVPALSGGIDLKIERVGTVNLYIGGKIIKMDLEDYVTGVVAAEMPASYEPEALKAQAVASRTYAVYQKIHGGCSKHPGADVCADSSSCQAYLTPQQMAKRWGGSADSNLAKIRAAVDSTRGQMVYYNGEPIEALYFASSGGKTEDCANVFSQSLPYLKSVESAGEESFSNYYGKVSVSAEEFVSALKEYSPGIKIDKNNIAASVGDIKRTQSDRVESIRIGNKTFSGKEIRAIFSLNSTNFKVSVSDGVVFETAGFGHGVGMSQNGANVMAKNGADYIEILKHYYTGVTVK